jgi:hypothetical protein
LPPQAGVQQRPLAAHEPLEQVPQLLTVRVVPQLSTPLVGPQVRFSRAQNWVSVSGAQHAPPAPHTGALAPHPPQEATVRGCPHESVPVAAPQVRPRRLQNAASVSGTQQVFVRPSHTPSVQTPHELTVRKAPQRSIVEKAPHARLLAWQSSSSRSGVQHVRGDVAEHINGAVQVPQVTVRGVPQTSTVVVTPQVAPSCVQS